jgi:LacI family transcriptional regulator
MQSPRPRTTLGDVAARADVSKATASRVLGGSRDRVSEGLAARVVAAAAELGYVPNPHAQALARAASPAVAVVVHDVDDPYFSEIARGALRVAAEEGRLVVICATFRDPRRELGYVAELRAQRLHAVLLAGSSTSGLEPGGALAEELAAYRAEGGRVAMMVAGHGHPAAVPDNRSGGRQAAQHLMSLGHRRMGVLAGPDHIIAVSDRLDGFVGATRAGGLPHPVVERADFTRAGAADAVTRLLERAPDVTALFALNDVMAVGAVRRLAQTGRPVPGRVSVVGFDDIPLAGDVDPGLTTVHVPMERIGAEAMRLALTGPEGDDRVTTFETRLIVRESTGPPPAS